MNKDPAVSNGHPTAADKSRPILHAPDVDRHSLGRVSVNSSWTHRRTTGQHDVAYTLFMDILGEYERRQAKESFDLDGFHLTVLLPSMQQRLEGVPELADIPADDFPRRQQILRELAARKGTKAVRRIREIAAESVQDAVAPLLSALDRSFRATPLRVAEIVDSLEQTLRDLHFPPTDFGPQKKFANAIRALEMLERVSTLAPKVRELLVASIRKRSDAEFRSALDAHAQDFLQEALRDNLSAIYPHLDELRASHATFRRNMAAVDKILEQQRTAARQRSVASKSSVLLELETPDEAQLLSGIRDRHRCGDRAALAALFSDRLEAALNETARTHHPFIRVPAVLTDLLTQMPPRDIAHVVGDVVGGMIGDAHTVYTAIRACGVPHVARELYERAAPLCSLSSRDHVLLNVETHCDLIVRLPQPRGAEDADIAERVREEFRDLNETCQFLEDPRDSEITIVRTLVGFPIGIEGSNAALLIDYLDSAAQGHHPHLFGLLPDSPHGEHVPQVLALARHHAHR